jgi:hypothetical protein
MARDVVARGARGGTRKPLSFATTVASVGGFPLGGRLCRIESTLTSKDQRLRFSHRSPFYFFARTKHAPGAVGSTGLLRLPQS